MLEIRSDFFVFFKDVFYDSTRRIFAVLRVSFGFLIFSVSVVTI